MQPGPSELITNGTHNFGTYGTPIPRLNVLDASGRIPRALANLRLKEWEAFQVGNGEWFLCGAVYDAKSLGICQLIATHLPTGRIIRWLHQVPTWRLNVARGLNGTVSLGTAKGMRLAISNDVDTGMLRVAATHRSSAKLPRMSFEVEGRCDPASTGHLVICHPFSERKALYSNKCMMPASGRLTIDDEVIEFEPDRTFMILDDHKGQYPMPMQYDWVTGATRNEDGGVVGFNLTANQVRQPEIYNENAVWIDGAVHRLGAVTFDRPNGVERPWHITDVEGRVDVWFDPKVQSNIHVGASTVAVGVLRPLRRVLGLDNARRWTDRGGGRFHRNGRKEADSGITGRAVVGRSRPPLPTTRTFTIDQVSLDTMEMLYHRLSKSLPASTTR